MSAESHFTSADPPNSNETPFGLSIDQLTVLQDQRDPYTLEVLGGIEGLESKLNTSITSGLSTGSGSDSETSYPPALAKGLDLEAREAYYGENKLPERKPKSFIQLVWIALQDKVLVLLSIVAAVSLAIGLYETFGQPTKYDEAGDALPKVEWVEGVAIIVAIVIVSGVGAGNDWQKERQFVKLNRKKENHEVTVIRDGHTQNISVFSVLVGDLVSLEPGDILSTDGILVNGYGIKTDESALTGESANVRKSPAKEVLSKIHADPSLVPHTKGLDPYMMSGSKVLEGSGSYIVTSVGVNSFHGKMLLSLQTEPEDTPLQEKLNVIAEAIAKIGSLAALVMFIVLFIRFLVQLRGSDLDGAEKGQNFLTILITAITIIVVAVPEGLPLAVTLALAFATTRMIKDNNLVRVLKACETMGGATAICSDKTGTLTQNRMSIVTGSLGVNSRFLIDPDTIVSEMSDEEKKDSEVAFNGDSSAPSAQEFVSKLTAYAREVIMESIVANCSAFETLHDPNDPNKERFIGSKTETALLNFSRNYLDMGDLEKERSAINVLRVYPFDSAKKFMATVIAKPSGKGVRLLVKGAAEIMVGLCSNIYDESSDSIRSISAEELEMYQDRISQYGSQSLRTIGLIYRDFDDITSWEPSKAREASMFNGMTLLGIVGIMDPLRPGVKKAVADCQHAGVVVRMVTGDNLLTAKSIAKDCGILQTDSDTVMEGPDFRKLSSAEIQRILPNLRVLARSSPDDKRVLVKNLKEMGDTVAVTGDGTNDAPALKLADVGFSMGIAGTEVAKEASEIILMDDNFSSIVKAIIWGRTVNDAVKKFLQFQLTVNITAVILTFVSAVASSDNESVLTAVQLLWVNLIMDTLAALALATDPPSISSLDRKPDNRKVSLITPTMWKIILGEATYQLIVSFILDFGGPHFFSTETPEQVVQVHALVFNTFVWMQYFKMFVARRLDNKMNMFEGIWRNWYYVVVSAIILGAQILIMFVGGAAFSIERQTGVQWAIAICCGFGSIPVGLLLRCIPDEWLIAIFPTRLYRFIGRVCGQLMFWRRWTRKNKPEIRVAADEESGVDVINYKWPAPFEQVKSDLMILKLRGGRWSQIKSKPKKMYTNFRQSISNSSASSIRSPQDSYQTGTTIANDTGNSQAEFSSSPSSPVSNHAPLLNVEAPTTPTPTPAPAATVDNDGFLAVPGQQSSSSSSSPQRPFRLGRSRGSSTSSRSSYSIEALTMVPTLVGGAIAGWAPEAVNNNNNNNTGTSSNARSSNDR